MKFSLPTLPTFLCLPNIPLVCWILSSPKYSKGFSPAILLLPLYRTNISTIIFLSLYTGCYIPRFFNFLGPTFTSLFPFAVKLMYKVLYIHSFHFLKYNSILKPFQPNFHPLNDTLHVKSSKTSMLVNH